MNRRLALAALALVALTLTSGCLGFFTDNQVSQQTLDADPVAPYAWDADADVHIQLTENATFAATYRINRSARSSIELYRRDGFGGRNALDVSALRYQYPNGTVITGSEFAAHGGAVTRTRDVVTVTFPTDGPNETARFGYSADSTPKRFSLPVYVDGSYEVVLPPDRSIALPVFGSASPGGYNATDVDGQTHIRWENVTGRTVAVQYYLERDVAIFGGIASVALLVGIVGALYYQRQIRRLQEQREEVGLDVDTEDDDFGGGPPPGMG